MLIFWVVSLIQENCEMIQFLNVFVVQVDGLNLEFVRVVDVVFSATLIVY